MIKSKNTKFSIEFTVVMLFLQFLVYYGGWVGQITAIGVSLFCLALLGSFFSLSDQQINKLRNKPNKKLILRLFYKLLILILVILMFLGTYHISSAILLVTSFYLYYKLSF